MSNKTDDKMLQVHEILDRTCPPEISFLVMRDPFQFLISVILSAQTTDERVNMVTPELFSKYPDPTSLAAADIEDVKRIIHTTGFFNAKAKNIIGCAQAIVSEHKGIVPSEMEELLKLPGVGRKSANCLRANVFSRRSLLMAIPWIVCVPLFFFSQWTHLVVWYHENNHFASGPLRYLPYILFAFYIFVFFFQNVRYFHSYSKMNRIAARYIVLGACFGVLIYFYFDGYKDYSVIFTSSILLYYVLVYIHMARMDQLTQLPNRQSFYQDIALRLEDITGVISIDMNELKYLNDTLGHEAGDMALEVVAGVFRNNCNGKCTAYRVGGDEFMVICRNTNEFDIRTMVFNMREHLKQTSYTCAFGYAMCSEDVSVEEALRIADERMYADKAAIKKELEGQGIQVHTRD